MKKIFFVLSLVFSVIVYGQAPPGYTLISARYQWLAGKFQALTIPSGGSPALQTGQTPIAGGMWYDSTAGKVYVYDGSWTQISGTAAWGAITGTLSAQTDLNTALGLKLAASDTANKWVSNIFRVAGKDSIIYYKGSTRFAVKDSTGGGGATTWQDLFDNEPGGSVMTATDVVLLSNNTFRFENGAGQVQFNINPAGTYQLGDVSGINLHSYIEIDDAATAFSFKSGGAIPLTIGFGSPLILAQYASGAFAPGLQFRIAAGDSGRYKPMVIDTTDGTAYIGYWFGGGGGNTIYTADDAITSDRTVDLNGKILQFQQDGIASIYTDVGHAWIQSFNNTDDGNNSRIVVETDVNTAIWTAEADFNDGDKLAKILANATASAATLVYTADTHTIVGGLLLPYTAQTGTYSVLTTDYFIDCTSGTFTATLPTAVGVTGHLYVIKNSGAGTITIATTGGQTIDGAATQTLSVQYSSYTLISDGANWKIY